MKEDYRKYNGRNICQYCNRFKSWDDLKMIYFNPSGLEPDENYICSKCYQGSWIEASYWWLEGKYKGGINDTRIMD